MKYRAIVSVTLISLLSTVSACAEQPNPTAAEATTAKQEVQKAAESEAATARQDVQKPSESEAIEAAKTYVNRHGGVTFQDAEIMAWGAFNEKLSYWPVKVRLGYTAQGADKPLHSVFALAISKDVDGKWKAEQNRAWRTDFK